MGKVEVIVRASRVHDARRMAALKSDLLKRIAAAGQLEIEEVAQASVDRFAAILVLTGGVERDTLKAVAQLPSPVVLIAHSGHNSLPACLEILARIRRDGGEGRILFGSPETIAAGLRLELAVAGAWDTLRFSRIGLIGAPSDWLVASEIDRAFLKGRLSIELVDVGIDELIERIDAARAPGRAGTRFAKRARRIEEASAGDIQGAVAIYEGLRGVIDDHRLAACTVRCFDLLERLHNTGCYALSRLNDEGIPAGCEGDLPTLLSLYIAFLLTDQPAFMGNIASIDPDAQVVGVTHCTCPLSLTTEYTIRTHFESEIGIGISGVLPAGPCTLFRLGGERLDRLFVREGTIAEGTFRDDLCRTQVHVMISEPIDELLRAPLGNHHVLLVGHHREAITRFFNRYLRS